jgi:tartrate dehydratase alpha subunit/fumarate hydratase class I-like protein
MAVKGAAFVTYSQWEAEGEAESVCVCGGRGRVRNVEVQGSMLRKVELFIVTTVRASGSLGCPPAVATVPYHQPDEMT